MLVGNYRRVSLELLMDNCLSIGNISNKTMSPQADTLAGWVSVPAGWRLTAEDWACPSATGDCAASAARPELAWQRQRCAARASSAWLAHKLCFTPRPAPGVAPLPALETAPRSEMARAKNSHCWPSPGAATWRRLRGRSYLGMTRDRLDLLSRF